MKSKIKILLLTLLCPFCYPLNAQNPSVHSDIKSDLIFENDAEHPCITAQEYELIERRCAENRQRLNIKPPPQNTVVLPVLLAWPLKAAANLLDCSYYHIAAYVDQNTATGTFQDFNCGTNTYDGHRGTDIATWPFNFYKMDNNLVEVVAAAAGTIIDKHDGEFDRNCASNTLTANYVIIRHSDGAQALYWHMKKNAVTTKAIGQTVAAGEYLGIVGASGSASGPHLHFEVWNGTTVATRIDPFSGTCNTLNAASWWANQKAYKETAVIKASVHTTDIVLPNCPTTETLNESTSYTIPFQGAGLTAGYAKFYIFLRDEIAGLNADVSILNPNGTVNQNWTYSSTANNKVAIGGWSKKLPTVAGKYTFQVLYNGIKCASTFDILTSTGINKPVDAQQIRIYPNPSNGKFTIDRSTIQGQKIDIYTVLGEKVYQTALNNSQTDITLDMPNGVYFYQIKNKNQGVISGKLIIQRD